MRLAGKTAIVTGGGSGFGEGIARKFVAEGAWVLIADRDKHRDRDLTQGLLGRRDERVHQVQQRLGVGAGT